MHHAEPWECRPVDGAEQERMSAWFVYGGFLTAERVEITVV